jgi:hypothetical protein
MSGRSDQMPVRVPGLRSALAACLLAGAVSARGGAPSPAGEVAALRAAVADLAASFGDRYPGAAGYLARLDAVAGRLGSDGEAGAAARAEFDALRREALIANPLVSGHPILFVVRHQYAKGHHNTETFFPAAQHEFNSGKFSPGGALKAIDFARGGAVRTLIDLPEGVVRDPDVSFDGSRILVSLRRTPTDSYHVWEVGADGSGLRQITTAADVDDLDPLHLPDGGIAFSSTLEPKYCMCNRHIMANLFRMNADGSNIRQIGKSTLFEGHGALLPDGRILYDRWEYVDRNFGDAQGLWTVYPDGTGHALYWGNNTASPGAVLEGRPVPGSDLFLATFSSCHDRPWGALALVDRRRGLEGAAPVVRTWPASAIRLVREDGLNRFDDFRSVKPKYEDPCPLGDRHFLCARTTGEGEETGIFLLDVFGNEVLLHAEAPGCFDPMPLAARPRPPAIPVRRDDRGPAEGSFYVADVYAGTHMEGVARGSVKWLRVVESPEKRQWTAPTWGGQGIEGPAMNWHDFANKRILGTVPVASDGSAWFTVPAERFVYFQLLDADGMMVQSMRSGTIVQPGETAGCIGCHDDRSMAAPVGSYVRNPGKGGPARLRPWRGPERLFNYRAEVQPVWDDHCVRCHDFGKEAGAKLVLAGDRDLVFNASYIDLWRRGAIRAIGAGPSQIQPARSWGAHASRLVQVLRKGHAGVRLSPEDWDRIVTWIDLNAPYYPSYASAHPENPAGRSPLDSKQVERLEALTGVPLRKMLSHGGNKGPQISFERPEISPCLAGLPVEDPRRAEALALLRAGAAELARNPEPDAEGFRPCPVDAWRDEKYAARQTEIDRHRSAIASGGAAPDGGGGGE